MAVVETPVYTVSQAAELLGCSIRSLYRWEQAGIIPKPDRVENGGVSTRVYRESTIDQIRKLVGGRLTYTALRRDSQSKDLVSAERQRVALRLAAELGLHEAVHYTADAPECSLALFIVRHIEQFDETSCNEFAARLASEPGITSTEHAVLSLDKLIAEVRMCLKAHCYLAAAVMLRNFIEVTVQWAKDPEFVVNRVREFCFAERRGGAAVDQVGAQSW
jgi:DNA-binding transcriptional MerR regulator